ncbi:hypothetical protein BKA69DRAFT_1101982 [Paraphysoderma sedebokerense]|nr:hypothetical protein BKA69DRAFT_1101982 [Paraphysoderma sedebokerense]
MSDQEPLAGGPTRKSPSGTPTKQTTPATTDSPMSMPVIALPDTSLEVCPFRTQPFELSATPASSHSSHNSHNGKGSTSEIEESENQSNETGSRGFVALATTCAERASTKSMSSDESSIKILSMETLSIPNETKLTKNSDQENILSEDLLPQLPVDNGSGISYLPLPRERIGMQTRSLQCSMLQLSRLTTSDTMAAIDKKRPISMPLPPSIATSSDYFRGQSKSAIANATRSSCLSLDKMCRRKMSYTVLDLRRLTTSQKSKSEDATKDTHPVKCDAPSMNPHQHHELQQGEKVITHENEAYSATESRNCDPPAIIKANECGQNIKIANSKSGKRTRNIFIAKFRTFKESCKAFRKRVKRILYGKFKTRGEL